ncbi:glycoside hydrolase TIM-barrel-like domain-containing protein [Roseibacterium beibuensis]|uniref:Host specificity protein n=1 Tax=[Roseibacterium] beibuensis TaxID=1193142 RepID=A0ABP9LJ67_9RHOB|nr:glycoside hydrolase TIM-barrel-like domain-containing protein [Roseibacterium beibuensis]MCS6625796.1 glycoside hydrolase TIM-barrel-like domain-containing protein [Roseibacterium beibuensis]
MATLLLSAAGAALGGMTQASVFGLTGAVLGRAVGATIGRVIDQRLMGAGSEAIEQGRVERFRITGAGEGAPVARLFGRMRLGGQVIWATQFVEHRKKSGGSKGAAPQPKTVRYSYSVSLAVALCEGEIARVGRIWADGVEIDRETVTMRLHKGGEDQLPDPLIEAVEGAGEVPAYRGIAYVVFEDLDLSPYGNRVPQFAFEVVRNPRVEAPHTPQAAEMVRAVAMMPGTGEYALSTSRVAYDGALGSGGAANVSAEGGLSDFSQSLATLRDTLPNLTSVSLIYSWFGDDLRAGACRVKPKVEDRDRKAKKHPWTVGALERKQAEEIARDAEGRPIYGGTPADESVIEAIIAIRDGGQEVMFYPFLLMEILEGNGMSDPWGGAEQAHLPWRGRITGDLAPGQPGSPDGTAANAVATAFFFGTVTAADFTVTEGRVAYHGPDEWSYTRFILHCAALCAAAGGVEAFCIGSEMRSLTQMRDALGFPAVDRLRDLAAEVRTLLPEVKLTYAADWSEYFGYHPQDGSGDVYFHLDPLWADENIDFIGIDNYMPVADWRDGHDHADAAQWDTIHDLAYLRANIEGGEGGDWYYPSAEARAAQRRVPITDGLFGKDWVFRVKALRDWWEQRHYDRRRGVEGDILDAGDALSDTFRATAMSIEDRAAVNDAGRFASRVFDLTGASYCYANIDVVPGALYTFRLLVRSASGAPETASLNYYDGAHHRQLFTADGTWREVRFAFRPDRDTVNLYPVDMRAPGTDAETLLIADVALISDAASTPWVPRSKPIRFTEFGCAAIDKGANQPNAFLDAKSAESAMPRHSNGRRDDLMQAQYLRAVLSYWDDPATNPVSEIYGGPMLEMDHAHAWAWDARPWPAFPNDRARWSDGGNWRRGHWLTGRLDAAPLDLVVAEICESAGLGAEDYDVSRLHGLVRGHLSGETEPARARLQSLMLAHGFHAVEREGKLVFLPLPSRPAAVIEGESTAIDEDGKSGLTRIRAPEAETVGRLRIGYTEAEAAYEARVSEAVHPGDGADVVNDSNLPMALTGPEGQAIAERWLAEARVARDVVKLALPPSRRSLGAGDMVALEDGSTWRIDRVEAGALRQIEAVRVEPTTTDPSDEVEEAISQSLFVPPLPVSSIFLDLPLLTGDEVAHAPHIAVAADPWPGSAAVYSAPGPDGFELNKLVEQGAVAGTLETPLFAAKPGIWDRSGAVRVRIATGALSSAEAEAVLNGANLAAIGASDGAGWEVIQFRDATLVGPEVWEIGLRLRGQQGTDADMPPIWPEGSLFVLLDGAVGQVDLPASARGLARYWRVGPARRALDDASYTEKVLAFEGVGLRPYSPAHLRSRRVGAGREVTWIRRSRIDADSWEGLDVPLGEASEMYLVRIVDAGGLRREATLGSPVFTYTDAMRGADGTAPAYSIEVAQVSDRFGPGPFARIEIND